MPRQSVSLTEPDSAWVKAQIDSKEYSSVSDAINDLIRQARRKENDHIQKIRELLIEAENSLGKQGYSNLGAQERLEKFKEKAQGRDLL